MTTFLKKYRIELMVFFVSLLVYCIIGIFLVVKTFIIDHPTIDYDIYLNFDNPKILRDTFSISTASLYTPKHPLMKIILFPITTIAEILRIISVDKAKTLFIVFITAIVTSLSSVLIYIYIDTIIDEKKKYRSIFLTSMFSFFSTNLVVSFTPESYPFSLLMLIIVTYYYSVCIKESRVISTKKVLCLSFLTSGLTITNLIKCMVPLMFLNRKMLLNIKTIIKVILIVSSVIFTYLFIVYLAKYILQNKETLDPISFIFQEVRDFLNNERPDSTRLVPKGTTYVDSVITYFFGSPVIFPRLTTCYITGRTGGFAALWIFTFGSWIQYVFLFVLFSLLVFSIVRNMKNKIILFILTNFLIDVLMHVVLKWGLHDAIIFGSHWVFIIPIFMGWLYNTIPEKSKIFLDVIVVLLLAYVIVNNLNGIMGVMDFAIRNYATLN